MRRPYIAARLLAGMGQNIGVSVLKMNSVQRDSLSVALTVGAYGSAFGAAAVADHFTVLQACLLSLLTFSGASQFAVVGVIGAGGSALSAIATSTLLGTRNALYGLRLSTILNYRGITRAIGAQVTIDESTGVALSQNSPEEMRQGFWLTGLGVFLFWNIFTVIGALGAHAIGNPSAWGLDAAVPAAFLGLLWPRLKAKDTWAVAGAAVLLSLALVPIAPAGVPIIACAFIAMIVGWRQ